jgi:predicted permease
MSLLRTITSGLRTLFRKHDVERDLDDEVAQYLEMATRENQRAGMSPEAAARAARIALGGVDATKEIVRSGGWEAGVETLWQDVRYAVRGLRRNPAFTTIALVTLALGVGANTAMFSVVNAVMLRPLPYRNANRLAIIWTDDTRRGLHQEATAYRTIVDWKSNARAFSDIAFFSTQRIASVGNDPARSRERTRSGLVSANFFSVLGVAPLLGRAITQADEDVRAPVVVVSYAFWQRRLGGANDVVGKILTTEDPSKGGAGVLTVIGVMPPGFYFPDKQTELWTPATTYWRFTRESTERFPEWARRWTAIGRLSPSASLIDARTDLARIGKQLAATYPSDVPDFPGFGTNAVPVLDFVAGPGLQSALWVLLGAVALVLLVACVNIANLLLARGATRQREFAVRRALGAGRGRLVRQLIAESVILAMTGGAIGVVLATWGTRILAATTAARVPRSDEIATDGHVLLFAAVVSICAGLMFGLMPAFRVASVDPGEVLKEGGNGTGSLRLRRGRGVLVMAQCAMAIVLLTGAGLLLKSLSRLGAVDPGFDPRGVLTVRIELPSESAPTAEERLQTSQIAPARARAREQRMNELIARLAAITEVESAGFIDDLFINSQGHASITIPGRAADSLSAGELTEGAMTSGFFSAMRVRLVSGRLLTRDDASQKIRALWSLVRTDMSLADKERLAIAEPVVVNESFAKRFFPNESPLGKRFCTDPTNKTYWYVIVGVIGDMHRQGLERRSIPEYFGPWVPSPNARADLVVRTHGDPLRLGPMVRREVMSAVPNVLIASVSTADAQLGGFSAQRRLQTWLLSAFAGLALVLAAVGIYGLVHYAVAERTRELGVRVALGATSHDVVRLVMSQGLRLPAIGIMLGLAVSAALTRVMSHLLFDVGATDPVTFVTVGAVLAAVAATACYVPARGAARVDPVRALKRE